MRLWSIHPKYLDRQGLLAVWREGLLARKVLAGKTVGYRNHPQLQRFRKGRSLQLIDAYLHAIVDEADRRNYKFDRKKLGLRKQVTIKVTHGQIMYEKLHLCQKFLKRQSPGWQSGFDPHPIFKVVDGLIEKWEKID